MNDAFFMGGLQRFGNLLAAFQGLFDGHGFPFEALAECLTLDQFHDQGMDLIGFLDSVDGGDVGVIQSGQDLGLAVKTRDAIPIPGKGLRQDLDGHLTVEFGIGGAIDLTHAALAELRRNLIVGDGLVDHGASVTDYPAAVSHW